MALTISTYVDPGVYIGEVVVPGAVNVATTPQQLGFYGAGDRQKSISNEAVQRGGVAGEALTIVRLTGTGSPAKPISAPSGGVQTLTDTGQTFPASAIGQPIVISGDLAVPANNGSFTIVDRTTSTVSYTNPSGGASSGFVGTYAVAPHAILTGRSDRKLQNTTVYRNGVVLGDNFLSYQAGVLAGDVTATRNLSSANAMALSLDGNPALTLKFAVGSGTAGAVQTGDTQFDITIASALATATIADIAIGINKALEAATALGYGSAYNAVASAATAGIRIVSPLAGTNPSSDVEVSAPAANDMNASSGSRLFTTYVAANGVQASTTIGISPLQYSATALYTIDYVNPDLTQDVLQNAGVQDVSKVGSFAGVGTFRPNVDYLLAGDAIVWGGTALAPVYPAIGTAGPASPYSLVGDAIPGQAGAAATISGATGGIQTLTGLTGMTVGSVGRLLALGAATTGANNGTWLITAFVSSSSVRVASASGGTTDANNGALTWTEKKIKGSLKLAFDSGAGVDVDLAQVLPAAPLVGYTYNLGGLTATAIPASQIASNINAVVANAAGYGPAYKAVASAVVVGASTFVQLTSPTKGKVGQVQVQVPGTGAASDSATLVLFNSLTAATIGGGAQPVTGAIYFVSYAISRPTNEYNIQKRFYSLDQARSDLGQTTGQNPLMIACEVAFANGAPSVVVVQVNDTSDPGTPTRGEYLNALNATGKTDVITDLVALSTDIAVQTDLMDHVEVQCSPTVKHYRRGWFGMPRNTDPGDRDTDGTYVYMSRRTLQVAPDSPARGRLILVAGPQLSGVSRDIALSDGTTLRVRLDSTYLAVAAAARKSSFTSPAATLAKRQISGFNLVDLTDPWDNGPRQTMAGQGVMVVMFDGGVLRIKDPVTTEKGGGGLAAFSYDNTSSQKDNITRKVDQALDANIVGIVPTDLADFVIDIKVVIRSVLSGEIGNLAIGPFTNDDGTTRTIDLSSDIDVQQDPDDPTKFFFKYFFKLRYAALRLFGEFSVDNPFFGPGG